MQVTTSRKLSKLFSALGDPTRYRIVKLISKNPTLCVSELAAECDISPAGASQHLSVLEGVGLLEPKRQGKKMCYGFRKDEANDKVLQLIEEMG